MALLGHAEKELRLIGMFGEDSDYGGLVGNAVMELMETFSNQGHSGYSAGIVSSLFSKLAKYEPLSPLTGEDDEWDDVSSLGDIGEKLYQNNRNSAVFKDGKDGQAYIIDAIVFNGDGGGFTSNGSVTKSNGEKVTSRQDIQSFPFNPKTFYIDVIDHRWEDKEETTKSPNGDWWTHEIKDETQLDEVWEYYNKQTK
jgi:hypothetical protein